MRRGRKGLLRCFAAGCAWLAVSAVAYDLANSSFEDPGGDGALWISDRAARWERWGAWFNRETSWTPVVDGQCIMAYHHWKIQGDETAGIYQDVPDLPANTPFSFAINVTKDKFTNCEYVEMRLEPFRGGQTLASQIYRMNDVKSGKWTTITVRGMSPATGIRVLVIVKPSRHANRKGSLKFDSASLKDADGEMEEGDNPLQHPAYGTIRPRRQ